MGIDVHTHILPQVDDGSAGVEESLAMLSRLKEQGVTLVAATPHFYPRYDTPEAFLRRRQKALEALGDLTGLPRILPGAEVYYFSGISDCEALPRLTIGQSRCILIEMPQPPWTDAMYRELEGIWEKWGLTPVIAHIDRYIGPWQSAGILRQLSRLPVLIQANTEFFLQRRTRGMALRLLRRGQIHLLGSDCHNLTSRRPDLGPALEQIEKHLGPQAPKQLEAAARELLEPENLL